MKIALITDDFLPITGGISNVMVNLSSKLTEQGDTVFILNKTCNIKEKLYFQILSNDTSLSGILIHNVQFLYFLVYLFFKILFKFKGLELKDKLKLSFFYCFYLKFIVRRIISIKNLVVFFKKVKIDFILSGTSGFPLLYSYIISKWFNIPLISIAHGDDFLIRYPFKIKTHIFQNVQKIIVTNRIMKELFLKIYDIDSNKINIIPLGVNIENSEVKESYAELRRKYNISPEDFVILTVCRLYPRKGLETVLKAIRLLIEESQDITFKYYIIGDGDEYKKIETLIMKLDLINHVTLLGALDENLKNKFFKLSDLFVLVPQLSKSSIEGFGIVFIEANYFKLPVIGSNSGGVKVAILDGKTGLLINPEDEVALKEKILLMYNNKQLRLELGENGHKRVLELFDWKKNALIYKKVINDTVEAYNSFN